VSPSCRPGCCARTGRSAPGRRWRCCTSPGSPACSSRCRSCGRRGWAAARCRPGFWSLVGPLLLAGLGNGLVIAPNQDFALGPVPRDQAGTAGGALITAQRLGAAIGIAVIGTALFGSGPGAGGAGSTGAPVPSLVHSAQTATAVNLCFVAAALLCAFGLPRPAGRPAGRAGCGRR
jgi:hypothetical protein